MLHRVVWSSSTPNSTNLSLTKDLSLGGNSKTFTKATTVAPFLTFYRQGNGQIGEGTCL